MIQRIQTLYLLASFVLMITMLFMHFADIAALDSSIYRFGIEGLARMEGEVWITVSGALPLMVLVLTVGLLLLINIFLYRNRRLQMRVCVYSIILEFGLIGLGYYYFYQAFRDIQVEEYAFRFPVIVPAICIILLYLAFRGIRKDEILIRSIDKIR